MSDARARSGRGLPIVGDGEGSARGARSEPAPVAPSRDIRDEDLFALDAGIPHRVRAPRGGIFLLTVAVAVRAAE